MLDLSIIIVNWNTCRMLADCLNAAMAAVANLSFEIIVVDNASTDGSQELVQRQFPNVHLIANTTNVGFAKANNQALRCSRGRYVLLLNSDAFVDKNTIEEMIVFMDQHPEAGIAGCKLRYPNGRLQPSCMTFPTLFTELCIAIGLNKLFPKSRLFGRTFMTYWEYDGTCEVEAIMGAFMLVRAAAIDEVGFLDERYFMYSEEIDWCYRFRQQGWKIYYYPAVEAVHLWGGSSGGVQQELLIQLYRSRALFFRTHYGPRSARLFKLLVGLNCLLRIIPGASYYYFRRDPQGRLKHRAFRQLLRALPSL
jgi:GT2 family glycosyltransferase